MKQVYNYSPSFTGECYRHFPLGKPLFEKAIGDAGLLDLLELRFGLKSVENKAIDRILEYKSALEKVGADAFYRDAFKKDPLATAKEILSWRDALVMEGFSAEKEYGSPRLKKLAEAEKYFHLAGIPERWKKVLSHAVKDSVGESIVVHYDINLLPRLIRETLTKIGVEKGLYDNLGNDKGFALDAVGKKIIIRYFGTVVEAYRWAADHNDCEAVICSEPFKLNAILRNREKPQVEANAGGDSSILQLFRLGLLLLERPVNVNNLLEYLRAGYSPIPGEQRYALFRVLRSEGGRGKKWNDTMSKYKDVPALRTFLSSLLDAEVTSDGKESRVSKEVVTEWCHSLADWAKDMVSEERKAYQMELIGLCEDLGRVVDSESGDTVDVNYVLKAVKTLYNPTPFKKDKAMAQSWDVVDSHRNFIDEPESLLWLKCNGGLGTVNPYSFLFQEEVEEMGLKPMTDYIRYDFNLLVRLLGKVKRIELCACDFDSGSALEEHPAVTLCKLTDKKVLTEIDMRASGESQSSGVFTHPLAVNLGMDMYPRQRDDKGEETSEETHLSATGIETLINYPYDFVLSKKLGFQDLSSLQLPEMIPTQGTVAHYVFERILKDTGGDLKKMRSLLQPDVFAKLVDEAAKEKGEILFMPEHRTLFVHFKGTVRKSIGCLLDILEQSKLTPKDSEVTLNEDLDGVSHISGSVDFYALTEEEKIVVIDFKYSKGSHYIDKLKEDKSIQLEIYSEALQKQLKEDVVAKAYYFFPANMLCTDDETGLFKGKGVVTIKKKENAFTLSDRIRNSINFRKDQLSRGIIEIGEGSPVDDLDYHNSAVDGSMIDIPSKGSKDNQVKETSPFATPTKYPIMKDFIE